MGTDQKGAAGIQIINSDWINECLENHRLINDREYLVPL